MNEFIRGLKSGFPIGLGYLPISFTFGLVAVKMGFEPHVAVLIAFTNLASAGQFAGIRLIEGGAPYIELALTAFVVNIRYALMSLALTQKLMPNISFIKRCIIAFGVTDEIFAIASLEKEDIPFPFFGGLMSAPIIGWTLGTFLGAYASGFLPPMLQRCMGIALYCMFIAIIIPPAKKSKNICIAIAISCILACMFKYIPGINILSRSGGGWVIIISAITAAAFCATFLHPEQPISEKTLNTVKETVKDVKTRR